MDKEFQLAAYDYHLPQELIAQHPAAHRDRSRLMLLDCPAGSITHRRFDSIIEYLRPGDLMVVNNTRVFPARLYGRKKTGGRVELLLLHYPEPQSPSPGSAGGEYHCRGTLALLRSSKRPAAGSTPPFGANLQATVSELLTDGKVKVNLRCRLAAGESLDDLLARHGRMPLPPYIKRSDDTGGEDYERYQTRYAEQTGSVAAPTAGLHFTDQLLERIRAMGVQVVPVTLHVGYGTFAPVRAQNIREHRIHAEHVEVPADTALAVTAAKKEDRRIWAVGTTSARTLEFAAAGNCTLGPFHGPCDLYIYPGYRFRVVDNLITNFHLPRSSLLFLVSAMAGRQRILDAYQVAIAHGYRFYSYGDAMAIITRS